jgi:ribosomal protein L11 methyltransferase
MLLIGNRLAIMGDWDQNPVPAGRVDVRLTPSFAFGVGHPTTVAVLQEMETLIAGGETVLDIGTGSGILAIAAIRLGATKVYAVDINPEAIEAVTANVASNGMERSIEVIQGRWPQPLAVPVDLAVMNIDDAPLIDAVLGQLDLTPAGKVVVVPDADDRTVVEAAALAGGLSLLRTRPAGTYIRPPRGPVVLQDVEGRPFRVAGSVQQQAEWRALVFQSGGGR